MTLPQVLEGEFSLADRVVSYASGTSIAHWPQEGGGLVARDLNDQGVCCVCVCVCAPKNQLVGMFKHIMCLPPAGSEVVTGGSTVLHSVPVLGFHQTPFEDGGRVVVYGDSNCLDSAHLQRDCFWLLNTLLKYATMSKAQPPFTLSQKVRQLSRGLPQRMEGEHWLSTVCVHWCVNSV